jgi:hypothetical protein
MIIDDNIEEKLSPYDTDLEVEAYKEYIDEETVERVIERHLETHPDDVTMSEELIYSLLSKYYNSKVEKNEKGYYYMSVYNTNSKWDWYEVGGRWSGMLITKASNNYSGVPGIREYVSSKHVDQACIGDIDWVAMREESKEWVKENWDKARSSDTESVFYKKDIEGYETFEEYLEVSSRFYTRAVITKEGEWIEPGRMGWWAVTSESAEEKKVWDSEFFNRFIKPLKRDDMITIVDCHI